jgi:hypothetical protein
VATPAEETSNASWDVNWIRHRQNATFFKVNGNIKDKFTAGGFAAR